MKDPVVRQRWADADSRSWEFWLGSGMYMGIFMLPELVAWGFTRREGHEDDDATESWEPDVDPDTVADMMVAAAVAQPAANMDEPQWAGRSSWRQRTHVHADFGQRRDTSS